MAAAETFANLASTTVTAGGTTAPAGGTTESWTVSSSSAFPSVSTGVTQLHVADISANSEIILVTNISGTTWSVTRGAESTTPVAHTAGFTVYQVTTAGFLSAVSGSSRPATLVVAAHNASAAWKNTADYLCAGTADDVTINAALAALPAQGGTVLLSDGQFNIANPIIPTISNSRLLGQGLNATTIKAANSANCNGYQFDVSQAISLIFCCIEGITFDGNSANNTTGYGCHINYNLTHTFWDFYLRDVWFTSWSQDGFWSTGGHGYVLDHTLAEFCGGNGINFTGGFVDSPPRIVNGTIKSNTGSGVLVATIDAYVGHNEISVNAGSYGLVLSASGCKAIGNQIRANTGTGVHVTNGSEGHELVGNTISSNGAHGVLLDDANCTITGNFFNGNSTTSTGAADEINIAHGTFSAAGNVITGNVIDCASLSRYGINFSVSTDTAGVAVANRIINPVTATVNSAAADTVWVASGGAGGAGLLDAAGAGGYAAKGTVLGWTCPSVLAQASAIGTSAGVLLMLRVDVPVPATISNLVMYVTVAGNTLANVFGALVDTSGVIQASTANRSSDSALTTNASLWTAPFATPYAAPAGQYYACLLIGSATTMPTFTACTDRLNTLTNLGCTAAAVNLRVASTGSGLSALPSSPITMSGISSNQNCLWAALT